MNDSYLFKKSFNVGYECFFICIVADLDFIDHHQG